MMKHVALSTLIGVCIPCAIAHAEVDAMAPPKAPVAAEHLKQGNRQYRLRDFQSAITEYKAGAAIEEAGVFWYVTNQRRRDDCGAGSGEGRGRCERSKTHAMHVHA